MATRTKRPTPTPKTKAKPKAPAKPTRPLAKPAARAKTSRRAPALSLQDLERETEKFLAPTTPKEEAILTATMELLGERGIDGTTTAEIARRAGVTERTLFRYFPSKRALIQRVMFPWLQGGLTRRWTELGNLIRTDQPSFKDWYAHMTVDRMTMIARHTPVARAVLLEVAQNGEFRESLEPLWRRMVLGPMVERVTAMQAAGQVRADIDPLVIARAVHCLNIGYFLIRRTFSPDAGWDDAAEIEQMAELLAHGVAPRA